MISLVITIIIILILAGVSINMITSNEGIINKAIAAKQTTIDKETEEQLKLAIMASYQEDGTVNYDKLKTNVEKVGGTFDEEKKTVEIKDKYYIVDESGSYEETDNPYENIETYYFQRPSTWESETIYAYLWNSATGEKLEEWPGHEMETEDNDLYSIEVDKNSGYDRIVFHVNETDYKQVKTNDLDLTGNSGKTYTVNVTETKTVYFDTKTIPSPGWFQEDVRIYAWKGSGEDFVENGSWTDIQENTQNYVWDDNYIVSYDISSWEYIIFFEAIGRAQTEDISLANADGCILKTTEEEEKWVNGNLKGMFIIDGTWK